VTARLGERRHTGAVFTRRVNRLLLILTLRDRHGLTLPHGGAAFPPCHACLFGCPLVGHTSKMGEFPTLACYFALLVPVHGCKSTLAYRHLTSVCMTEGTALRMPQMSLAPQGGRKSSCSIQAP
jgi:hypothetical protein